MVRPKTASKKRKGSFRRSSFSTSKRMRSAGMNMGALLRSAPDGINFVDVADNTDEMNTTSVVQLLNGLIPGVGEHQRLGRKITMKSIIFRYSIEGQVASASAHEHLRLLLVYDRQPNGAAPVFADIIQSTAVDGTSASAVWANANQSNRERFAILRDMMWTRTPSTTAGAIDGVPSGSYTCYQGEYPAVGKIYIRLKGLETQFNTGTAGTVADMQTGALWLVHVGSAAATSGSTLFWSSRVFFTA